MCMRRELGCVCLPQPQAVQRYREQHGQLPPARDASAADACVQLAREINEARKKEADALSVDEVDEERRDGLIRPDFVSEHTCGGNS